MVDLFATSELRHFISYLPGGKALVADLPESASQSVFAHRTVELLRARGYVTAEFFERLAAERPRRRMEIDAIRADLLV